MTWAVGHLVQLAEPDEYDAEVQEVADGRPADRAGRASSSSCATSARASRCPSSPSCSSATTSTTVINACDAGREGELIFAWLYEKAGAKKPVQRLWLSSMTDGGDQAGVRRPAPGARSSARLEQAARSRSEADWIVGMNATRAATIRLRSSFDGAVSLGRVQTPTLAIVARREEEIRAFKPEPYWLVDATFEPPSGEPGRALRGPLPRRRAAAADDGRGGRGDRRRRPRPGRRDHQAREDDEEGARAAPLRPDLAAARGQHALRLLRPAHARRRPAALRGAQGAHLPAHELALPVRATWSARSSRRPRCVGKQPRVRASRAAYVTGLDVLPLGRVVNDAKVTDHHAIIPTRAEHRVDKMSDDDQRDLRHGRPALPRRLPSRRGVREHAARDDGGRARLPHPRPRAARAGLARRLRRGRWTTRVGQDDDDEGADQTLPKLERGERVDTREVAAAEKETKPPRRYSDASLLGAMETAGKLVDDDELREAMKDSGIGTPATRAAIIERLIDVGYIERDGRALVCTEKGLNVIRLLDEHPLTSPGADRRLGAPADASIEQGEESRERFMADIAEFAGGDRRRARRQAQGRPHPAGQPRPVPGLRPRHRREPQGLLVLVARGPGLRLRDLEEQGRQDAADGGRASELIATGQHGEGR